MSSTIDATYNELVDELRQVALLRSCGSVLSWDEQTYLPPAGGEFRAEQLALLAGMSHEQATSSRIGDLLAALSNPASLGGEDSLRFANVREARRHYDRATQLPRRLVEELSRVTTLSQQAWVKARKAQDFAQFLPWLEQVVALKREEAQAVGQGRGPAYDALLDDYEPGMTSDEVASVFDPLKARLVDLVAAIRDSGRQPDVSILTREYPVDRQAEFSRRAATAIGFDFDAGRLDIAAHPFCSGIGPGDCRLTTRYDASFPRGIFRHAARGRPRHVRAGFGPAHFGTAAGEAASLGIHESQSRMWENLVGRSRAFWQHFYPAAQATFPAALDGVVLDDFHAAINDVRPSWIRVEADEVTYNLHIMLRFDIERALIGGDLQPAELPGVWNETFQRYFGMTPPNDALGCIQDVHWSAGLIGYFPTYALGNMYAAQFFEAARVELGDLDQQFARGEFAPLLGWLRREIHSRGLQFRAADLVKLVTGKPLSSEPLLRHLNERFRPLYGV
ncbi:MAG: carboxypeptidase M32 [Planctomycetaceae bacterium]